MSIPTSEHYRLLNLVADIRKACGDPHGALMQDDLVEHIQVITEKAQRWDEIGDRPITVMEGPAEITTDTTILRVLEHETVELRVVDRQHAAKITDRQLADALHYPRCWDTATYPTLADALWETVAGVGCSVCGEAAQAQAPASEEVELLGYASARLVSRMRSGELSGISVIDKSEDGHTVPVYTHPPAKVPEGLESLVREAEEACQDDGNQTMRESALAQKWLNSLNAAITLLTTPTPAATPQPAHQGSVPEEAVGLARKWLSMTDTEGGHLHYDDITKMAEALIAKPQPEGDGWIRCRDQLPKLGQRVELFSQDVVQHMMPLFDEDDDGLFWDFEVHDYNPPVDISRDQWRPMPQPPQEQ